MTIAVFIISLLLLAALSAVLIWLLYLNPKGHEWLKTVKDGFVDSLRSCGLSFSRYDNSIELYKWTTSGDDAVCPDCQKRAEYPPMDIADWMKEGLPRTPEADTECAEDCRCQLILYKSVIPTKSHK